MEIGRSLTHCGACGSATVVPDTERSRRSRQFSQSEPPAEAKKGKVSRRGSWGNSSTYRSSRLSSTSVIISPISPSEQHTTRGCCSPPCHPTHTGLQCECFLGPRLLMNCLIGCKPVSNPQRWTKFTPPQKQKKHIAGRQRRTLSPPSLELHPLLGKTESCVVRKTALFLPEIFRLWVDRFAHPEYICIKSCKYR